MVFMVSFFSLLFSFRAIRVTLACNLTQITVGFDANHTVIWRRTRAILTQITSQGILGWASTSFNPVNKGFQAVPATLWKTLATTLFLKRNYCRKPLLKASFLLPWDILCLPIAWWYSCEWAGERREWRQQEWKQDKLPPVMWLPICMFVMSSAKK